MSRHGNYKEYLKEQQGVLKFDYSSSILGLSYYFEPIKTSKPKRKKNRYEYKKHTI